MTGKICVSIATADPLEMTRKVLRARHMGADLVEARFDHSRKNIPEMLKALKRHTEYSIFTLRSETEGGKFIGTTDEYFAILKTLAESRPYLLDVELAMARQRPEFIADLKGNKIPFLLSSHNLKETPEMVVLLKILNEMKSIGADVYKIVTTALHATDYGLTRSLYRLSKSNMLVAFPVGEQEEVMEERVKIIRDLDAPFSFAALDKESATAKGQLILSEMIQKLRRAA